MPEFEIYRSKQNGTHFVAIRTGSDHHNAVGVRESTNLVLYSRVSGDDRRIAFDAAEAAPRIARDGFYAFAVDVEPREHRG